MIRKISLACATLLLVSGASIAQSSYQLKFATLPMDKIPDGIDKNQIEPPKLILPESPFTNNPVIVPHSNPQKKYIGISPEDANNIMSSGKKRLLEDPYIKAQRIEVPKTKTETK